MNGNKNFKTVAGLGSEAYVTKAMDTAFANISDPNYVDRWIAWFKSSPCDKSTDADEKYCENCVDAQRGTCGKGQVNKNPEFYLADLEEVAVKTCERLEAEMRDWCDERGFYWDDEKNDIAPIFSRVTDDLKKPGFVEGMTQ